VRPIDLRLRNFRSYFGEEASFDFRGRRLVGIVGPIGSGKSSILDAIAFALYGRTASVGRGTKALIHQRAEHGAVAFRFEVDGEVWEAQRMLRRKGAGDHALYRLKDDTADAEKVEQITGEADVNTRIVELLGLDFDAFGRSVLLAQGRFAEFLTAPPVERDKVLKGVFSLDRIDRMRSVAKERAREAEIEAEKATVSVQHLAELEASTTARRESLAAEVERLAVLEEAEPTIRQLTQAIESAEAERKAAEKELLDLRSLAEGFPDEEELTVTLSAAQRTAEQRTRTAERLEQTRVEMQAAEERSESAAASRDILERASALIAARDTRAGAIADAEEALARGKSRLQQAVAETAGQQDRAKLAEREVQEARERLEQCSIELGDAEQRYHDASHADMATTLRRGLEEGESCPVCEQTVGIVPPLLAGAADVEASLAELQASRDLRSEAAESHTKASALLESARTAHQEAMRRSEEAAETVQELEERLDRAGEAAAATAAELRTLLGSDDVDGTLSEMRELQGSAAAGLDAAAAARDRARSDHDAAIEAEQSAGKRLADLRVALTAIAARLEDAPEVGDDPESIAEAAGTLQAMLDQSVGDEAKRRDQATAVAEDHTKALAGIVEAAGITGSFDEALGAVRSKVEVLRDEISRAEMQLEGKADQIARRDAHVGAMKTHQALAADLTDARFVRFLLDDERRRLAELGSEHFQLLTNGRYRFTEDGGFDIVDLTTADAVRKADSLSGGETFLASLALALALAEIVTMGGGRLDAFFLDEGFGTLDPEHLDLAMEGIESLVSDDGNRLVVVVSHVPELRHRIEDLIELDRSPTTGDTKVLSG
jgi:DNA repair protein SbcC/Rad50